MNNPFYVIEGYRFLIPRIDAIFPIMEGKDESGNVKYRFDILMMSGVAIPFIFTDGKKAKEEYININKAWESFGSAPQIAIVKGAK